MYHVVLIDSTKLVKRVEFFATFAEALAYQRIYARGVEHVLEALEEQEDRFGVRIVVTGRDVDSRPANIRVDEAEQVA